MLKSPMTTVLSMLLRRSYGCITMVIPTENQTQYYVWFSVGGTKYVTDGREPYKKR